MALPVWGNLEKSQIDSETIEEAIARLIQAHEDDPNAHVEAGESLHSHKAQAIIDHVVASIIADKIKDGEVTGSKITPSRFILQDVILNTLFYLKQYVYTAFESADGWVNGGDLGVSLGGSIIQTGGTINTEKYISDEIFGAPNEVDYDNKNPYFQCALATSSITNQLIVFGVGGLSPAQDPRYGFGFRIENGELQAIVVKNNFVDYFVISGITLTNINDYRAVMDSGNNIKYYVNGVLRATHSSGLPDVNDPVLLEFYIKNLEAANKALYLRYALFSQDR